jgi:hypothetical protein
MMEKIYNWLLKMKFYFIFYLWDDHEDYEPENKNITFRSVFFKDGQWNKYLEWYAGAGLIQDWNTYRYIHLSSPVKGFAQHYGTFNFYARLDGWTILRFPAIWLLCICENNTCYYEIDIELPDKQLEFNLHLNSHGKQSDPDTKDYHSIFRLKYLRDCLERNFYWYTIKWDKDSVKFYINGIKTAQFKDISIDTSMALICSKLSIGEVTVTK